MKTGGKCFFVTPVKVVFNKELISIGCTDITVEAAYKLVDEHRKLFKETDRIVYQEGKDFSSGEAGCDLPHNNKT
jgi:hypothetical protein